jgi:acetate kinase
MNIFIINSGSSSIKYQLFKMPDTNPVCSGLVERIGSDDALITHKTFVKGDEKMIKRSIPFADHEKGLHEVAALLTETNIAVINSQDEIEAVGHRIVHGGETFKATTIITQEVKDKIEELFSLAPLHNPANLLGIEVAEKIFTRAKQVAVFDTAFHQSLPEKAFRYAIPEKFYTENRIRAYGFHGTSHKYVSEQAAAYLANKNAKLITIHLGNGCSITAINAGKAVDTSMGFGPLSGLVMGTRSGDIDPSVIFHLIEQLNYTVAEVSELLNKKSGMLGLTGMNDMRDVQKAIAAGNKQADLATELYAYRIKKYIGAYVSVLNGLDAIVFTAGVGENAAGIRHKVCTEMDFLGIQLDPQKNENCKGPLSEINRNGGLVKILVIATNEEAEMVKQCYELLNVARSVIA